jgi:hypothetical protein
MVTESMISLHVTCFQYGKVGVDSMGRRKAASTDWIGSLVTELDLVEEAGPVADLSDFRAQMEEFHLLERIRQTVAAVNEEVGYQALELLDFLPPQRSVMRLAFSKKRTEYTLEIVVRASGPGVVFHSAAKSHGTWERYLYGCSRPLESNIAFKQDFNPAAITDETIRVWFSYLLSGFNKKFSPGMYEQPRVIGDFELSGLLDKASA